MRTRSELLADLRDMGEDETLTAIDRATAAQAADLLDATTPRPWPPPKEVSRCLGWDTSWSKWRACVHEYGEWVFEDGCGKAGRWCSLWQPMPPDPEVEK